MKTKIDEIKKPCDEQGFNFYDKSAQKKNSKSKGIAENSLSEVSIISLIPNLKQFYNFYMSPDLRLCHLVPILGQGGGLFGGIRHTCNVLLNLEVKK